MTDSLPSPEPKSTGRWRELLAERGINVHPAADYFPLMPPDELGALAADIRKNGLRQGITLYTPQRREEIGRGTPTDLNLLDGRNRLAAIDLAFAGSESELAEQITWALNISSEDGDARLLYGDQDPATFVISANAHRRHLTREQRREFIEKLLAAEPWRSDRETAKLARVSHSTVATVRAKAEARGQIDHAAARVDALGRRQPAHKTMIKAPPSLAESTSPKAVLSPSGEQEQALLLNPEAGRKTAQQKHLAPEQVEDTAKSADPPDQERVDEEKAKRTKEQHDAADEIAATLAVYGDAYRLLDLFTVSDAADCEFVRLLREHLAAPPAGHVPPPLRPANATSSADVEIV